MAEKKASKVEYAGKVLIDLTGDTVTAETLLAGVTAHDKTGTQITGTAESGIDTSDATATAGDIAYGKTAYVNGALVTGNVTTHETGAVSFASSVSTYDTNRFAFGAQFAVSTLFRELSTMKIAVLKSDFGNAKAADVRAGSTFTSPAGLMAVGTAKTCYVGTSDPTASVGADGDIYIKKG